MKKGLYPKLLSAFLLVAIVPVIAIGVLSYFQSKSSIEYEEKSKLNAINDSKAIAIEQHINEKFAYLNALTDNQQVAETFAPFVEEFDAGGLTGDGHQELSSAYDTYFNDYIEQFGFYDVFFIDNEGNIVYTAFKEADLGQNLTNGELADSGLAQAFTTSITTNTTSLTDYAYYAPSDEPAAFFATPYTDPETGEQLGVLALQLAGDRINELMMRNTGLGETGQAYLVGSDKLLRSDFRDSAQTQVGVLEVDSTAVNNVLNGERDAIIADDTDGHEVLTAYTPVEVGGLTWGLISEIHTEESFAGLTKIVRTLLITLAATVVIVSLFSYRMAKSIVRPVQRLLVSVKAIANDDLSQQVTATSKDEIGELSTFFEQMRQNLAGLVRRVNGLSSTIDQSLQGLVGEARETRAGTMEMAASMSELSGKAHEQSTTFTSHTESLGELSQTIQKTAENSTTIVQSSSKTEELAGGGFNDLSLVTDQMVKIQSAIDGAMDKSVRVQQASKNVLQIVELIESIANETNLLSLNASIEAARAGEQGKGFAVVAEEIRKLANESKRSMQQVQKTIDEIMKETADLENSMLAGTTSAKEGVELVDKAAQSFHSIVSQSKTVVGEVMELSAATEEITSITEELASQAEQLRVEVEDSAADNEAAATSSLAFSERMEHVNELSESIAQLSEELRQEMERYKVE